MMIKKLFALSLLGLALGSSAANLTPGVNPPAIVQFAWDPSPAPNVDGQRLYYGAATLTYTNLVSLPTGITNFAFTMPVRGVPLYFVLTVTAQGLESLPTSEVSVMAKAPPAPAGMKPPVILVVQTKSLTDPNAQWVDNQTVQVPTDSGSQEIRLKLGPTLAVVNPSLAISPQVRALNALHSFPMPPAPGK